MALKLLIHRHRYVLTARTLFVRLCYVAFEERVSMAESLRQVCTGQVKESSLLLFIGSVVLLVWVYRGMRRLVCSCAGAQRCPLSLS